MLFSPSEKRSIGTLAFMDPSWNQMSKQQLHCPVEPIFPKIRKIEKVPSFPCFFGKLGTFWRPRGDSNLRPHA